MKDKKCLQTLCVLRRKALSYGRRGVLGRKVVGYGGLGAALTIILATLAWASGAAADTCKAIHIFTGKAAGSYPTGNLTFDAAGNLYGTTESGGSANCFGGCGVVWKLAPNPDGTWTVSILHSFTGANGADPHGELLFDATGNLYGTTFQSSGSGCFGSGCGVVFKLAPTSSGWSETVLHSFLGQGSNPHAPVIFDPAGNLYGTTQSGTNNNGLVFEITK